MFLASAYFVLDFYYRLSNVFWKVLSITRFGWVCPLCLEVKEGQTGETPTLVYPVDRVIADLTPLPPAWKRWKIHLLKRDFNIFSWTLNRRRINSGTKEITLLISTHFFDIYWSSLITIVNTIPEDVSILFKCQRDAYFPL